MNSHVGVIFVLSLTVTVRRSLVRILDKTGFEAEPLSTSHLSSIFPLYYNLLPSLL